MLLRLIFLKYAYIPPASAIVFHPLIYHNMQDTHLENLYKISQFKTPKYYYFEF